MDTDETQYKDSNYMKKNKNLCEYCSYRVAVPSKNNQYCSEICRLLHLTLTKDINVEDIAKLIKLSKVDLIQMILSLKCINIDKKILYNICDKKLPNNQLGMTKNEGHYSITFD